MSEQAKEVARRCVARHMDPDAVSELIIAEEIEAALADRALEEAIWWVPLVPNGISKSIEKQRDDRVERLERESSGGAPAMKPPGGKMEAAAMREVPNNARPFLRWWLTEGIKHMPRGDQPPEHGAMAELAWDAALSATASPDALRVALETLCDKLDKVGEDSKPFFNLAYTHGMTYQGAHYGEELRLARAALASSRALDAIRTRQQLGGGTRRGSDANTR